MDEIIFSRQTPGIFAQEALRQKDYPMANRHFHDYLELYFLLDGERYYFVEQDTYLLSAGMAILVNRNQIHKTSKVNSKTGHHRFLLHLDASILDNLLFLQNISSIKNIGNNYWGIARFSQDDWLLTLQLIEMLKTEMNRNTTESNCMGLLFTMQLVTLFVRNRKDMGITENSLVSGCRVNTGMYQKVHEIALYLQNHCDTVCTLDEIAAHFFISTPYLTRIFKSVTSFTVIEYLTVCRIRKAKLLLRNTNLSITEISSRCGFGNITYFEKVFRRMTECTPLQYRKTVVSSEKNSTY